MLAVAVNTVAGAWVPQHLLEAPLMSYNKKVSVRSKLGAHAIVATRLPQWATHIVATTRPVICRATRMVIWMGLEDGAAGGGCGHRAV